MPITETGDSAHLYRCKCATDVETLPSRSAPRGSLSSNGRFAAISLPIPSSAK